MCPATHIGVPVELGDWDELDNREACDMGVGSSCVDEDALADVDMPLLADVRDVELDRDEEVVKREETAACEEDVVKREAEVVVTDSEATVELALIEEELEEEDKK